MIRSHPIGHDIHALLPEVRGYLGSRPDVGFAYQFGGFARGKPSRLSDVDIAVCLECDNYSQKRIDILSDLNRIPRTEEIDLVVLNTAPPGLRMRVLRDRQVLAENRPFLRHSFESAAMRACFDYAQFERRILSRRVANG